MWKKLIYDIIIEYKALAAYQAVVGRFIFEP